MQKDNWGRAQNLVAGEQVVEALDGLVQFPLPQVRDGLWRNVSFELCLIGSLSRLPHMPNPLL